MRKLLIAAVVLLAVPVLGHDYRHDPGWCPEPDEVQFFTSIGGFSPVRDCCFGAWTQECETYQPEGLEGVAFGKAAVPVDWALIETVDEVNEATWVDDGEGWSLLSEDNTFTLNLDHPNLIHIERVEVVVDGRVYKYTISKSSRSMNQTVE
jgi:hypothetical protein